jgi:hypothetical protein
MLRYRALGLPPFIIIILRKEPGCRMDRTKLDDIAKILDKITKSSKKNRESQKELYADNMLLLLADEGPSERSAGYLFDVFDTWGAEPFFGFLSLDTTDRVSALKDMLENARSCNRRDKPLKFMLNLLALCANSRMKEKTTLIGRFIEALPALSKKKNGGDYNNIEKSIADSFLLCLGQDFEMPSRRELGLSGVTFFTDKRLEGALAQLGDTAENNSLIKKIRVWAHGDDPGSKAVPSKAAWIHALDEIKKYLESSDTQIKNPLRDLDEKNKRIIYLSNRIEALERDSASIKQENEAKISELLEEIRNCKSHIQRCEDDIALKEREIEERKLLRLRDREDAKKSAQDFKGRLAHELRFDYIQYRNVITAEMSSELGEIMRDRLKSIFKILAKNGLKID